MGLNTVPNMTAITSGTITPLTAPNAKHTTTTRPMIPSADQLAMP